MALKRKLDRDSDDLAPTNTKQLKLFTFPNIDLDTDVAMSEAEPMYPVMHHSRLQSTTSSSSSNSSDSPMSGSPEYPTFELYPLYNADGSVISDPGTFELCPTAPPQVGLLQPSGGFVHHGSNCTQIPKLRIACASSFNGQRTMWSHCEQCGAISMVESD